MNIPSTESTPNSIGWHINPATAEDFEAAFKEYTESEFILNSHRKDLHYIVIPVHTTEAFTFMLSDRKDVTEDVKNLFSKYENKNIKDIDFEIYFCPHTDKLVISCLTPDFLCFKDKDTWKKLCNRIDAGKIYPTIPEKKALLEAIKNWMEKEAVMNDFLNAEEESKEDLEK